MSRKSIQISLPAAPSAPVGPRLRKDIGVDFLGVASGGRNTDGARTGLFARPRR